MIQDESEQMLSRVFYRLIWASDMSNSAIDVNATNDAFKKLMTRQNMDGGAE